MLGQRGSSSASAGGGGQSQQELIEEAERLQRQLQRLSRERSSPELNRVSSQLQQAIQEMKKSLDKSQQGSSQEATAQGIRALQQLEDARRALARSQDAGLNQGLERAAEESKQLLEQQKQIQEALDRLSQEKQHAGTPEFQKRRADLSERKAVQADRLKVRQSPDHVGAQQARQELHPPPGEHQSEDRRRSGEDFITHPLAVAKICAGMRLDTATLVAAPPSPTAYGGRQAAGSGRAAPRARPRPSARRSAADVAHARRGSWRGWSESRRSRSADNAERPGQTG